MKNWFAASLAALVVLCAGTAIASIPSGESTSFSVGDPAVTVISSGGPGSGGSYSSGTTFFLEQPEAMTFTAAADGVCQVTLDGQVLSNSGEGAKITYGIAVKYGETSEFIGQHGITTTRGDFSGTDDAADLARTTLVPVKKGQTYTLGFGVTAPESSSGTAYPNETYICYG